MNDSPTDQPMPEAPLAHPTTAHAHTIHWGGLIWAVPLAALAIVVFLGVRAFSDRGIDVVVTFDVAAGARVDDTKVIYQGVEAGRVTAIDINPDGRRVDMTLRMDRRAENGLNSSTQFWLIGAKPNLNDISSFKAAVAGLAIGVASGTGGTPQRRFVGLSEPPIILPGTRGTAHVLSSPTLGTVRIGSPIYFRGQEIGRVSAARFEAPRAFKLDIFIFAPYDRLIRPNAAFWISSPVQVALTDQGASANLTHVGALFNGAIELEVPEMLTVADPASAASAASAPAAASAGAASASASPAPAATAASAPTAAPASSEFVLYPTQADAEAGAIGPEVPYAFNFNGPGGDLTVGAPVRLLGFSVGVVRSVRLVVDAANGASHTEVVAALFPRRLHVREAEARPETQLDAARDSTAVQAATDALVTRLLAQGYRAQLVQKPPLIGGRIIALERSAGAKPAALGAGRPRQFPSVDTGGGVDETMGQINELLAKINRVPIEAIGQDVRQAAGSLNKLVSSPQLTESLRHLNGTLAQAEQMMNALQPQVGPLMSKLNSAADEVNRTAAAARGLLGGDGSGPTTDASVPEAIRQLNDAARSIRTLSDYLGRHPESLIRGRRDAPAAGAAGNKDTP